MGGRRRVWNMLEVYKNMKDMNKMNRELLFMKSQKMKGHLLKLGDKSKTNERVCFFFL